jgi:hypothetical protein
MRIFNLKVFAHHQQIFDMRLLSTIVLALIPTAFASPSQEEQLEFQQVLGQLAEFGESLFTAPPPRDGPSICWNGFARGDGSAPSSVPAVASTECMEGTELFGDRCYVPCHNGYKAWGPFCLATSNSAPVRTYQRGNGKLLADQSTVATINNADFVVGNCPASLPHQCTYLIVIGDLDNDNE